MKVECEKLAQEKTEMQRHYVMVSWIRIVFFWLCHVIMLGNDDDGGNFYYFPFYFHLSFMSTVEFQLGGLFGLLWDGEGPLNLGQTT